MHRLNPNGTIPQTLETTLLLLGRRRSGICALEAKTRTTEGPGGIAESGARVLEETEADAGC